MPLSSSREAERYLRERAEVATTGCWLWTKSRSAKTGYGHAHDSRGVTVSAHRLSYSVFRGPIPQGLLVLHTCDIRHCVNPDHLYIGTHLDNGRDARERGRTATGDRNATHLYPEKVARGERQGNSKLTAAKVREIRALVASGLKGRQIAPSFGIHLQTVKDIMAKRSWKHVD